MTVNAIDEASAKGRGRSKGAAQPSPIRSASLFATPRALGWMTGASEQGNQLVKGTFQSKASRAAKEEYGEQRERGPKASAQGTNAGRPTDQACNLRGARVSDAQRKARLDARKTCRATLSGACMAFPSSHFPKQRNQTLGVSESWSLGLD
jgi:hypothetical protein